MRSECKGSKRRKYVCIAGSNKEEDNRRKVRPGYRIITNPDVDVSRLETGNPVNIWGPSQH
jgi:hypothetical protein